MSYKDKALHLIYSGMTVNGESVCKSSDAESLFRQADAEIEKLREELANVIEHRNTMSVFVDSIQRAALGEDPIKLIELAKQCPTTTDGFRFIPDSDEEFWCVYRESGGEDWKVSKCRTPEGCDEFSMAEAEWDHSFGHPGWIVLDAEDNCKILGVYRTRESADKAKEAARES